MIRPIPQGARLDEDGCIVPANAGQPLPGWEAFNECLQRASFHRADDSGREWGQAGRHIAEAGIIAVRHRWRGWQIAQAVTTAQALVTLDEIVDACIAAAREIGTGGP